jgi:hypothetical protein
LSPKKIKLDEFGLLNVSALRKDNDGFVYFGEEIKTDQANFVYKNDYILRYVEFEGG